MSNSGIIILAAGSSSRLGKPKQLLPYQGRTLLQHIVGEAFIAELSPIVVVTGANAEQVATALDKEKVELVHNAHWQEGMGTGIVAGISKLLSLNKDMEAAIISVCDQPFLSAALFQELLVNKTEKGIVACTYADTIGTPVLFDSKYFKELSQLTGKEGAKKLLHLYNYDVATIPFSQGNIDIDTIEDYNNLLENQ